MPRIKLPTRVMPPPLPHQPEPDLAEYARRFDVALGRKGSVRSHLGPEERFLNPGGPKWLSRPEEWSARELSDMPGAAGPSMSPPLGGWAKSEVEAVRKKVRETCRCDRYHFPHRKGGGLCR